MESEYIALSECTKEAVFIHKLLKSLHHSLQEPLLICMDYDTALDHVKNNVIYVWTKYIDTWHHYIWQVYTSAQVDILHIPATIQTVDILTKPLGNIKHQSAVELLNINPH